MLGCVAWRTTHTHIYIEKKIYEKNIYWYCEVNIKMAMPYLNNFEESKNDCGSMMASLSSFFAVLGVH